MREFFGDISPHFAPLTPQNAERENGSQRYAMAKAFELKDSGEMHPEPGSD